MPQPDNMAVSVDATVRHSTPGTVQLHPEPPLAAPTHIEQDSQPLHRPKKQNRIGLWTARFFIPKVNLNSFSVAKCA